MEFIAEWAQKIARGLAILMQEVEYSCSNSILCSVKEEMQRIAQALCDINESKQECLQYKTYVNSDVCTVLHRAASAIFEQKKFEEAECAFSFLVWLAPGQYAFWVGLGHAAFGNHNYSVATNSYAMAASCKQGTAWPHLWAANVFEAERNYRLALQALEEAFELSKKQTQCYNPELDTEIMERISSTKQKLVKI